MSLSLKNSPLTPSLEASLEEAILEAITPDDPEGWISRTKVYTNLNTFLLHIFDRALEALEEKELIEICPALRNGFYVRIKAERAPS